MSFLTAQGQFDYQRACATRFGAASRPAGDHSTGDVRVVRGPGFGRNLVQLRRASAAGRKQSVRRNEGSVCRVLTACAGRRRRSERTAARQRPSHTMYGRRTTGPAARRRRVLAAYRAVCRACDTQPTNICCEYRSTAAAGQRRSSSSGVGPFRQSSSPADEQIRVSSSSKSVLCRFGECLLSREGGATLVDPAHTVPTYPAVMSELSEVRFPRSRIYDGYVSLHSIRNAVEDVLNLLFMS